MEEKQILLKNIDKIHTTSMGVDRILKNLQLNVDDVVGYCQNMIKDEHSHVYKKGKNYYVEIDHMRITINSYSFTIITAHMIKNIGK